MRYLPAMRFLLLLLLTTGPAFAWDFDVVDGKCTLAHEEASGSVVVTFDPATNIYRISVARAEGPWQPAPVFSIRYDGAMPLTISTGNHVTDSLSVSVEDSGFGNVLNGLQYNSTATASLGGISVQFSLQGAAPEVEAFRECAETVMAV